MKKFVKVLFSFTRKSEETIHQTPYGYWPHQSPPWYFQPPTLANYMAGYGYPTFNNPYGFFGYDNYGPPIVLSGKMRLAVLIPLREFIFYNKKNRRPLNCQKQI